MFLRQFDEFCVVDVTSSDNNDVGADVVGSMEVDNLFLGDGSDVFSDTLYWLSHHMVSEGSVMSSFKSSFQLISLNFDAFSIDGFSFGFDLVLVEDRVGEAVTKEVKSLGNIVFVDGDGVMCGFSACTDVPLSTEVGDFLLDLSSSSVSGSSFVEMFEEVGNTTVLNAFLSGSSLDIDRNGGKFTIPWFAGNSNSIV